jgi:hypothetical protein
MGRMKEFKVGKAFTLGLDEITFLKVECERTGSKASYLINKWIREKMTMQVEEIRKTRGPEAYCTSCRAYKEHIRDGQLNMSWLCETCGNNQTEKIDGMIRRSKH